MSGVTQDIVYNQTGQSFIRDCPEGRPSSITSVSVFDWATGDDGNAESATTGSASVETNPNTTFDANSGFSSTNRRLCNLTATTGITVGRRYLATNAGGAKEWIEVASVSSGASATARLPLQNDYVSGDSFVSTRISISIADAWIQSLANISAAYTPEPGYRVRWVYVVGGVTYVDYTYARVVRVAGGHSLAPDDVERLVPGFIANLPPSNRTDRGRGLIDEAYRQVELDLYEEGVADDALRDRDIVNELTKWRTVLLWAQARAMLGGDPGAVEIASDGYQKRWNQLVRGPSRIKPPVDSDGDGSGGVQAPRWLTRR